jgi:hypothetical protein
MGPGFESQRDHRVSFKISQSLANQVDEQGIFLL